MMMQRGHAHPRNVCQLFHAQRPRIICPDPSNDFRCAMALISDGGDCSQPLPFCTSKYAVNDLALNQWTKKWDVVRCILQIDQATECSEEVHRGLSRCHCRSTR